jgi:hypothetical protein
MERLRCLLAVVVFTTGIAACSQTDGSASDLPTATQTTVPSLAQKSPEPMFVASPSPVPIPIETPLPTASATEGVTDPATVVAADGIGPYVVGARLSDLQSRGMLMNIAPSFNCDASFQNAEATGRYADELSVGFNLGRLTDVSTESTDLVTPSGARVGMLLTELHSIYGRRGTLITGTSGNQAFSVHVPDTALGTVFYLDETNTKARSMSAGVVERLDMMAVVGEGC